MKRKKSNLFFLLGKLSDKKSLSPEVNSPKVNSTPVSGQPTLLLGTIVTPTPTPSLILIQPETSSSPPPSTQLDDETSTATAAAVIPQELTADAVEINEKLINESSIVNNNAKTLASTVTDKSETENSPPNKGASPPPSLKKVRIYLVIIMSGYLIESD